MKTRIEEWDESFLDIEDYQVERAANRGALDAINRARRCGTRYVIWEDGQVKSLRAEETEPYVKRLLENLDRLNRKIAELGGEPTGPFMLNETPKT